jgi:hypothetical protein
MIRAITNVVKGQVAGALGVELTRGGLVAAVLEATVNGQAIKVPCHFNPSELSIKKTNAYDSKVHVGHNIPDVTFTSGGAQSISLTLWFDSTTTLAMDNIRRVTDKLWKFVMVDPSIKDSKSQKSRPPEVKFTWEQFKFTGVVTTMTHTYVLFNEQGAPMRAKVSLDLQQTVDEGLPDVESVSTASRVASGGLAALNSMISSMNALSSSSAATTSSSTNSSSSPKQLNSTSGGVVPQQGTRIDHVAAATTGDSSNQRKVAENNNIDNPMKLPKGQVIS